MGGQTRNLLLTFDNWIDNFSYTSLRKSFQCLLEYIGCEKKSAILFLCMHAFFGLLSYLLIIDAIWRKENTLTYKIFIGLLPVLSFCSEIMQYYRLLPGTFDIMDICSYLVAILLFILIKNS